MNAVAILKVVFGVSFAIPIIRHLYVHYIVDIAKGTVAKLHELRERLGKIIKRRFQGVLSHHEEI
jgi:hypothetical protein